MRRSNKYAISIESTVGCADLFKLNFCVDKGMSYHLNVQKLGYWYLKFT